jgi:acetoin utilization deacetylase AcuC-like enzyme
LANRTVHAVGGTLLTARLALEHGLACNSAGGTHHAHPGFGSGFCIFNDLAVTAAMLLRENTVNSVLVIDLDVHQGDGTAAAFRDEPRVFTFSMHCQENFPFRKVMGDLDIPVPAGTGDEGYMDRLTEVLPDLLDSVAPDLVLYDAGVDVFAGDRLGRLELSLTGITRRDSYVIAQCRRRNIPVAGVIGGGYDRDVRALAHQADALGGGTEALPLTAGDADGFVDIAVTTSVKVVKKLGLELFAVGVTQTAGGQSDARA